MLPHLSAQLIKQQLQLNTTQNAISSTCGLRPLLGALSREQQLAGDLYGQVFSSGRSIVTGHSRIPKAQHDRYRTPPQNYVQLLQHIARSRDVSRLSRLVKHYGAKFDAVHAAAAVAMLPKLYQPPAPGNHLNDKQMSERKQHAAKLLAQLQMTAAPLVPRMYARQVSSITHALSRCSNLLPSGTANSTTQRLLDSMLTRLTKDNARLLWQGATGPSITQLLHGLARMGYSPASSDSSAAGAAAITTQQLCRIIAKEPSRLQMRELATSAWSLARMSKRRSGLLQDSSKAAALDAISAEVVARKLWLRPQSMTGLLTAAAWLQRRDEALLAAVCEEAIHQIRDLRPAHMSAFVCAFSSLGYTPPPELLSGIVSESRRHLQHFDAQSLGLLLQGLQQLGALDKQLLADIAAGIAAESEVRLNPKDAVRILAAFVAVPDAGTVKDVEGMAQLIASAIRGRARSADAGVVSNLVVCYSKLPYHHPMVPQLLESACENRDSYTLSQWVKLLQSAGRLGFGRVVADRHLEAGLSRFYRGADRRLQQHLQHKVLHRPGGTAVSEQHGDGEEKGLPGMLQKLVGKAKGNTQSQPGQQQEQQEQPSRSNEYGAVAELAFLLSQRHSLADDTVTDLADAGVLMLPALKLRQLSRLLAAVTSRDNMLANESVRQLVSKAAERIKGLDLGSTPTATTTVLVSLLQPLSKAVSRGLAVASGEQVIKAVYAELLPVLEECDQQQLQRLWYAMRQSGVDDVALSTRAKEVAQRNGWQLQSGSRSGSLTVD